jgi:hypothetical protein
MVATDKMGMWVPPAQQDLKEVQELRAQQEVKAHPDLMGKMA